MDAAKDGLGHDEDDGEDPEQELIQGVQKNALSHMKCFSISAVIYF